MKRSNAIALFTTGVVLGACLVGLAGDASSSATAQPAVGEPPPEWAEVMHDLIQSVQRAEYEFRAMDEEIAHWKTEFEIAEEKYLECRGELEECEGR